jgi:predicted RNA-binding Zn-ribbon protein involved in translation (DUF1610 family)
MINKFHCEDCGWSGNSPNIEPGFEYNELHCPNCNNDLELTDAALDLD